VKEELDERNGMNREDQIEETKEEKKAAEEYKEKWQSSEESDEEAISIEEFK
jgi:hypothetical protein